MLSSHCDESSHTSCYSNVYVQNNGDKWSRCLRVDYWSNIITFSLVSYPTRPPRQREMLLFSLFFMLSFFLAPRLLRLNSAGFMYVQVHSQQCVHFVCMHTCALAPVLTLSNTYAEWILTLFRHTVSSFNADWLSPVRVHWFHHVPQANAISDYENGLWFRRAQW